MSIIVFAKRKKSLLSVRKPKSSTAYKDRENHSIARISPLYYIEVGLLFIAQFKKIQRPGKVKTRYVVCFLILTTIYTLPKFWIKTL